MLEKMKHFVRKKNICVLATVSDHKPYCSLMAYITDATCEEIYMVTHKNTTKFNNLQNNPLVSLLIDSRETQPRFNIVLVVSDALRQDVLGCYGGYARTPNIDQLAGSGVLFENAYSTSPWTPPSAVSIFCA